MSEKVNIDQNKIEVIADYSKDKEMDNTLNGLRNSLLFKFDEVRNGMDASIQSPSKPEITKADNIVRENNILLNRFLTKLGMVDDKLTKTVLEHDKFIFKKYDEKGVYGVSNKTLSVNDFDRPDVLDRNESLVDQMEELNDNLKELNKKDRTDKDENNWMSLLTGLLPKVAEIAINTSKLIAIAATLKGIWDFMQSDVAAEAMQKIGGVNSIGFGVKADSLPPLKDGKKPEEKHTPEQIKEIQRKREEGRKAVAEHYKKPFGERIHDAFDAAKEMFGFGDKPTETDGKEIEGGDMQGKVYNAFIHAGFSKNQALALTAEVGRETGYQSKNLFGTWDDSNRENSGMISWTGTRRTKLLQFLKTKGVIDKNGKIIPGQKALDAQAEFVMKEMKEDKSYNRTKTEFLENPNVSQEKAAEVLGKNYIRWDMKNLPQHKEVVKKYYSKIKNSVVNEENNATASKQVNTKPQTSKIEKPVKTSQLIKADEKNEISTKNKKKETVASNGVIVNQPNTVNNNNTTVVSANLKPYIEDESYHMLTAKTGCYQAFTV